MLRRFIAGPEPLAAKVPEITLLFWIIKVLTTGMGEAASDFLGKTNLGLAGVVGLGGFAVALRMQLNARTYRAPVYWFCVAMVAVFGTMVADAIHVAGLPYPLTTTFYGAVTAFLFYRWHRSEGTLSIHSISTRRRELYYWSAVLATFALGTAAGDLTAMTMSLGFLKSALLFAVIIALPALAWWRMGLNEVAAFWAAYVVTRPLGASFADWFGKERARTGLGYGDGTVALLAALVIAALVAYVTVTRRDVQRGFNAEPLPQDA
jgi:uncharacterized membrane-anchored protein